MHLHIKNENRIRIKLLFSLKLKLYRESFAIIWKILFENFKMSDDKKNPLLDMDIYKLFESEENKIDETSPIEVIKKAYR